MKKMELGKGRMNKRFFGTTHTATEKKVICHKHKKYELEIYHRGTLKERGSFFANVRRPKRGEMRAFSTVFLICLSIAIRNSLPNVKKKTYLDSKP